jgi:alpha-1,6-mannosyltransferase
VEGLDARRSPVAGFALGVAAVAALSGVALVVAAAHRADRPASSPIEPPGDWRAALIVGALVALAGYLVGSILLAKGRGPFWPIALTGIVVQLLPLLGPTLLSTDVWSYWMYGRIGAVLGGDAYADPPSDYPDDIAFGAMGSSWHDTTSLYGPVWTGVSWAAAKLAGDDPELAALLLRGLAAAAVIAAAALAGTLARRPAFAFAFVAWNPLLALHFAGGGHNDATMMAAVLLALVLAERGYAAVGGVAWALAIGIKWVPAVFLALWLLARRARAEPLGLVGLVAGLAGVAFVTTAVAGMSWVSAFGGLSSQARRTGSIGLSKWLGDLGLGHRTQLLVIAVLLVTVFTMLATQALRGRARLGLAGSALAAGQGWLNPWYASWGVTLAAPEEDRTAQIVAALLTAFLLTDAIPR